MDTPTDEVQTKKPRADKGKKNPAKGRRKSVLDGDQGDFVIMEIAGADSDAPRGSLIPLAEVPRFHNTQDAERWIKNESGDRLANRQIAVVKFTAIMTLAVEMKPVVTIRSKPRN